MSQLNSEAMSNFKKQVVSNPGLLDQVADMLQASTTAGASGGASGLVDISDKAGAITGGAASANIGAVKQMQSDLASGSTGRVDTVLPTLIIESPTLTNWVNENFGSGSVGGSGGGGGPSGATN